MSNCSPSRWSRQERNRHLEDDLLLLEEVVPPEVLTFVAELGWVARTEPLRNEPKIKTSRAGSSCNRRGRPRVFSCDDPARDGAMGKTGDFDAFYTATASRTVHYVYATCGDLAEAQDAVQEA